MQVSKYRIIVTPWQVFDAFERFSGHSSTTRIDGVLMGRVGTRSLTTELAALKPLSLTRLERIQTWHAAQYEEAYEAIIAEYPEAARGTRSMGAIDLKDEGRRQ